MNGATPAMWEVMNQVMNGIFIFLFSNASFPLLYRAWARSSDVSSSSAHCCVDVMPLYTEKKRSMTAEDNCCSTATWAKRVHCLMDPSFRILHHHSQSLVG